MFREVAGELAKRGILVPKQNLDLKNYAFVELFDKPANDLSRGFGKYYLPYEPTLLPVPNWDVNMSVRNLRTRKRTEGVYDTSMFKDLNRFSCRNHTVENRHKIFLVTDSFGRATIPFFALAYSRVEFCSLNAYAGSLLQEIEEFQPEIVLLMMTGRHYPLDFMLTPERMLTYSR